MFKFMALWKLAFKNLLRNPRRSLVTGLAIAMGFGGLTLFNGYSYRIERALAMGTIYNNHAGHISIIKKGWFEKGLSKPKRFSLTENDQRDLGDFFKTYESEFLFKTPLYVGIGLISNGCRTLPFYFKGLERNYHDHMTHSPEFNRWSTFINKKYPGTNYSFFTDEDSPLMITHNLALLLNKKVLYTNAASLPPSQWIDCQKETKNDLISQDPSVQLLAKNKEGGFAALNANIVGHYIVGFSFLDDVSIEGPITLAQKLYDTQSISRLLLFLKNPQDLTSWKSQIRPLFEKRFSHLEMVFYDDARLSPFYVGTSSFLKNLTFLFVLIAGISITLTIINSLTISVLERSKEIGTLRALGFTPSQVAWLFGREMLILTILSLILGWILAAVAMVAINSAGFTYSPPGASEAIKLEVTLEPQFQIITFLALGGLVLTVSYWLSRKRIKVSPSKLLVEN